MPALPHGTLFAAAALLAGALLAAPVACSRSRVVPAAAAPAPTTSPARTVGPPPLTTAQATAPAVAPAPAPPPAPTLTPTTSLPGVVRRETLYTPEIPLRAVFALLEQDQVSRRVEIATADGSRLPLLVDDLQPLGPDSGTMTGTVDGEPDSFFVLSYVGEAEAGCIQLHRTATVYNISYAGNGTHRWTEVDATRIPGCAGNPADPLAHVHGRDAHTPDVTHLHHH